jgi:hypothetical protein
MSVRHKATDQADGEHQHNHARDDATAEETDK